MTDQGAMPAYPEWIACSDRMPESGVPVLIYVVDPARPQWARRLRAFYAAHHTHEQSGESDWFDYDEENDTYWLPAGWYEQNEYEETNWHVTDHVTHWMPLPEPPALSDQPTRQEDGP